MVAPPELYFAQDAAGRRATVEQVTTLSWRAGGSWPRGRANGTILMMDDRKPGNDSASLRHAGWPLVPRSEEKWATAARYYHKTFALNALYAQRYGLDFVLVRPTRGAWMQLNAGEQNKGDASSGNGLCPAWCRVKLLAAFVMRILAQHGGSVSDHWVLYIDSDAYVPRDRALVLAVHAYARATNCAPLHPSVHSLLTCFASACTVCLVDVLYTLRYVREQHVDVIHRLADPRNREVHFAIAREEPPAGAFRSPKRRSHGVRTPSMNAGVLFVRASSWSVELLSAWTRAPDTPVCAPFRQMWPCEQQCFHELLRNRTMLPPGWRTRIATAPMQLFNSPCTRSAMIHAQHAHARERPSHVPASSLVCHGPKGV